MRACTSCAPPPANFPEHTAADHYAGDGACSVCGPEVCPAFTAPPEPVHDPRPLDEQLEELRAFVASTRERLTELHAWTHEEVNKRDAVIMRASDGAEHAASRLDVVESELRQLTAQLSHIPAAPPA